MAKQEIAVHKTLLDNAIKGNYLKPFAMYLQVRASFRKPFIYNYNTAKLAKITGLDRRTCKKYVDVLLKEGLISFLNGHLQFHNHFYIAGEGLVRYIPTKDKSHKKILDELQYLAITLNITQQSYKVVNSGLSSGTKKVYRKVLKQNGFLDCGDGMKRQIYNSSRQIAKVLNTSHTQAARIIRKLKKLKYISSKEVISQFGFPLSLSDLQGLNEVMQGYFFNKEGVSYIHHGIKLKLLK